MAEKRRPCFAFLLKKQGKGKSVKVELFKAELWPNKEFKTAAGWTYSVWELGNRYRLRINGKWNTYNGNDVIFTFYEFRDLLWRSIKKMI